jgi:murein L,D-transpeptidase YcbB/YkuD
MADSRVAVLARRLEATGELEGDAGDWAHGNYRGALVEAVLRFQARHGLVQDAKVGPKTLRALNVPADERIRQIRRNLERSRAYAAAEPGLVVVVNIPAFRADVSQDGATAWSTPVIVGETETPTPELRALITEIVVNPTWSVPAKIAAGEMLPEIKRDPGFLARGGYVLYSADGAAVDPRLVPWESLSYANFPYRIVQRPGPVNQLGRVKFVFPNVHSVYIHDTPAKHLFERSVRALSHGCIRMREPMVLAEMILAAQGHTAEAVAELLATAATTSIQLAAPVPIQLRYQTVEADTDGTLFFYEDIYGLDAARPGSGPSASPGAGNPASPAEQSSCSVL